jgi:hypothetical protein
MGMRSLILAIVLGLYGPAVGWAQSGPIGEEQAADSPMQSAAPTPADGGSSGGSGNWFTENVTLSAGIKMWAARWQAPFFATVPSNTLQTSASALMMGPTATLAINLSDSEWLNSVFVNFTWLEAGGFDFDPMQVINPNTGFPIAVNGTATRRDYTIQAGLSIWKGLGIFGGYYNNQQQFTVESRTIVPPILSSSMRNDLVISGPIVGVFANVPMNEHFGLYGTGAMGFLNFSGPGFITLSGQAYSTELGFNVNGPSLWKIDTSLQIGYRAQIIQLSTPNTSGVSGGGHANDITYGPTVTVLVSF